MCMEQVICVHQVSLVRCEKRSTSPTSESRPARWWRWVTGYDVQLFGWGWDEHNREMLQGVILCTRIHHASWHRPSGPTGPRKETCQRVVAASSTPTTLVSSIWRLPCCRTPTWPRTSTTAALIIHHSTTTTRWSRYQRTTTSITTILTIASIISAASATTARSSTKSRSSIYR